MKKKFLLSFSLIALLIVIFAISVSAADPLETWDISATSSDSVTAYLCADLENEGMYTLTINGTGNMKNWSYEEAPWYSSYSSKITSVTIEDGVTNIGDYAFYWCENLTSIVIPEGVTIISSGAFYDCSSLTSIVIPDSVTCIGNEAFYDCSSLTSIVIPEGVTSIGYGAFQWCSRLTSIVIPEGVTSIGYYAFFYCSNLTSIVIPESVTSIGNEAFFYCSSLTNIIVNESNQAYKSIDGNLYSYDGKTLIQYAVGKSNEAFTIPDSVISIGDGAFSDCSNLTSIVIPEGVTSIGERAFLGCSSLTSIVIPEGVTSIGYEAFCGCSSLTSIVIPEGVTSIGYEAFCGCSSLTSIVIPEGVTSIGGWAFSGCYSLTSIAIPEGVTSIGWDAFAYCSSLTIYCEATSQPSGWDTDWNSDDRPVVWGHMHTYNNKTGICICGTKVSYVEKWDISATSNDSVTAYLCAGPQNSGMYTLTISGTGNMKDWTSYSSVPWYSLYDSKIASVTIEEGVTSIGSNAFSGCSSLTSIVIPEGVTSIGDHAFYYCSRLTRIVIPEGVTNIGSYAFERCSKLTSIVIPEGVISIGDSAFSYCSSLTSIVIPEGVTSIGDHAFYYCSRLTRIVIPEGVTSIGDFAFDDCSSLTSIVIPDSVTSIGDFAFQSCSSLTSIVIPEGVTSIGYYAFSYCSSLTSIVIPEGVTSIGFYAFYRCSSLTIYCEATSQPSGWDTDWNYSNCPVVWGYFDEEACLNAIFTFKGYSFNESGSMAVGFDIDYEALAKYEEKTGKTLEIGVVFAGYDLLNGSAPLDQAGNEISLENGFVVKFDITPYNYLSYDFVITGIDEAMADTALVIAAYIYNGENVKYEQENGLSDTVTGISYNEAIQK